MPIAPQNSVIAILLACCLAAPARAQQDGVPIEMLDRTLLIRHGDAIGSAFEIERHHKKFLVTARHVVAGLPETDATLQVMRDDKWVDYATIRTLFPKSPAVDIAVLETRDAADETFYVAPADRGVGGATFGQNVWFLGFPYGIGTHIASSTGNGVFYPFIKHGILSAIDSSDPDANIIFIDGHNNPGFSGGPVLYVDLTDHKYKILGVISSYRVEATQTAVDGKLVDSPLLANSGIIQSYSIRYALDAIDAAFH